MQLLRLPMWSQTKGLGGQACLHAMGNDMCAYISLRRERCAQMSLPTALQNPLKSPSFPLPSLCASHLRSAALLLTSSFSLFSLMRPSASASFLARSTSFCSSA